MSLNVEKEEKEFKKEEEEEKEEENKEVEKKENDDNLDAWEPSDKHLELKKATKKHIEIVNIRRWSITKKVAHGLYHNITQAFLGIILIISLFLPDFWVIGNPSNDLDPFYNGILIACFAVFTFEIFLL